MDKGIDQSPEPARNGGQPHGMRGLLIAQAFGQFNDQAWKQLVILLAMAAVVSQALKQEQSAIGQAPLDTKQMSHLREAKKQEQTAIAQAVMLSQLLLFSLPGGVLADRVSKRSVILAMKVFELMLMMAGTAALLIQPKGGLLALGVLGLLGVQTAFFLPAKYGILPEILPHERLSAGNGLLEMISNLAMLSGIVAGGVILKLVGERPWLGGLILSAFSVCGLLAALTIPRVKAARAEGGLGTTLRLAWESIKADRVLRLALIGQVFVWAIATLVPPPIYAYNSEQLRLEEWQSGLPFAALGIGIAAGCLLAGRLSASKVEYGLLPMGALGLMLSTLAFAAIGPRLGGTIVVMTLLGIFSGLLFVPLNALLQWRSPPDRRGAIIAVSNVLVYVGMFMASILALGLGRAGIAARDTFLGASIVLLGGFLWALSLGARRLPAVHSGRPGSYDLSRADRRRIKPAARRGRPAGAQPRLVRRRPLRDRQHRPAGAVRGLLRILRQAVHRLGSAVDEGDPDLPQRRPEDDLAGVSRGRPRARRRGAGLRVPGGPAHADRADGSVPAGAATDRQGPGHSDHPGPSRPPERQHLQPGEPQAATRADPLPRDDFVRQAAADRRVVVRDAPGDSRARPGSVGLPEGRSPPVASWVHPPGAAAPVPAGVRRPSTPRVSYLKALAGSLVIARALRPRWQGQEKVGILLPASVGAALVNLAATLAGKAVVNLNFTAGRAGMESAAAQAGLRTVVTSRAFLEKAKLEAPKGTETILLEDVMTGITTTARWSASTLALIAPVRLLERLAGAAPAGDGRHRHHHLQQRQHGRAQGRDPVALQHRFQHRGHRPGLSRPAATID